MARRSDAGAVMVGTHEADLCLSAYDRGHMRVLYADHERRRLAEDGSDTHYARARGLFGAVEEARYGGDGTITLPPMMRRKAEIEDLALFVGVGGTFEMWAPQVALDGDDPNLRELAAWRSEENDALVN
jgi:MraZ protein